MIVVYHAKTLKISQVSRNLTSLSAGMFAQGYRTARVPRSLEPLLSGSPVGVTIKNGRVAGFSSAPLPTRERKIQKSMGSLTDPQVVLYRSTRGLGDAIMLESVVSQVYDYLQDKYDDASIVVVIDEALHPVFENHPAGITVMSPEKYSTTPMSDFVVFDVSVACANFESEFAPAITKNRPEIWCEHIGMLSDHRSPTLYVTPEEKYRAGTIISEAIRKLGTQGIRLIGVGYRTQDEWRDYPHMVALVVELSKIENVAVLLLDNGNIRETFSSNVVHLNRLSLRELFACVSLCDAVVAPDTAHVHIAGALGVSQFAIFGPTDPSVRLADYTGLCTHPPLFEKCGRAPCWYSPCAGTFCLSLLHPKKIRQRVEAMLE